MAAPEIKLKLAYLILKRKKPQVRFCWLEIIKFLPSLLSNRGGWATMAGMGWDLIGHTWAADMLRQHIAADRLRHAYPSAARKVSAGARWH
jgi:hypothetical protein